MWASSPVSQFDGIGTFRFLVQLVGWFAFVFFSLVPHIDTIHGDSLDLILGQEVSGLHILVKKLLRDTGIRADTSDSLSGISILLLGVAFTKRTETSFNDLLVSRIWGNGPCNSRSFKGFLEVPGNFSLVERMVIRYDFKRQFTCLSYRILQTVKNGFRIFWTGNVIAYDLFTVCVHDNEKTHGFQSLVYRITIIERHCPSVYLPLVVGIFSTFDACITQHVIPHFVRAIAVATYHRITQSLSEYVVYRSFLRGFHAHLFTDGAYLPVNISATKRLWITGKLINHIFVLVAKFLWTATAFFSYDYTGNPFFKGFGDLFAESFPAVVLSGENFVVCFHGFIYRMFLTVFTVVGIQKKSPHGMFSWVFHDFIKRKALFYVNAAIMYEITLVRILHTKTDAIIQGFRLFLIHVGVTNPVDFFLGILGTGSLRNRWPFDIGSAADFQEINPIPCFPLADLFSWYPHGCKLAICQISIGHSFNKKKPLPLLL